MSRVVVTGLGLVTPLGADVETAWKNIIAVFHTAGAPPSSGSIILAISGWTQNISRALTKSVAA